MRRLAWLGVLCFSAVAIGRAQTPSEFVGRLEPALVADALTSSLALQPASDEARKKVGSFAAADDVVFTGDLSVGSGKRPLFLIAAGSSRAVLSDLNGDGGYEADEKVVLTPSTETGVAVAATLRFATPKGRPFASYPVQVGLRKGADNPPVSPAPAVGGVPQPPRWYLSTSFQAFADGSVTIDGKPVKVRVAANADLGVDPSKGYQYVDCDGDGVLDQGFTSWEMGYGRGAPVVFHLGDGDRYVSIKSLDPVAGTITLAARQAADYERIELRVHSTLPDFWFRAMDGTPRKLSDFRGKYLLIDFWGTWCGPCVGEIPFLKKAYETYKDKGLEILGMDYEMPDMTPQDFEKGLEKVKTFLAENGVTWTQARTESIKPLYERRFQIVAWPTIILLDPEGTVLSVGRTNKGEPALRGDKLDQTLARFFEKD